MRLSDLDEVIEALERASEGHAICAIDITGYCNCGFGDLRDRALARLRKWRENAVEGYASRVGDQCWPDFRADDKHTGYAFHEPALLITTPREER